MQRVMLLVNPAARRAERGRAAAERAFADEGIACDVFATEAPGDATALTRQHALNGPYDAVFTLGGDGTAMEAITGLADTGPAIGILPGGTGNVLVRSLGIPLGVSRAVKALVRGSEAAVDLGRLADGRHFAIGLGVGLDERMIAGASALMKRRAGVWAYVWSATKAIARLKTFTVRLTVDGVVHEREAASVLIANLGTVLGGLIRLGDGILHDDGILHACLFSPNNFADAARIFGRMLLGTAHLDRCTYYVPGKTMRLETDPPQQIQADGELIGVTPVDVTVRPGAARLLIPAR